MLRKVLAALAVLVVVIACAILRLRAADPEVKARSALQCFIQNEPHELYEMRVRDEETKSGLSLTKFMMVWNELFLPAFRQTNVGGIRSERLNDPPTEGTASAELTLPNGSNFSFAVAAWVTEDAPKVHVLWSTLCMTWLLRFALDHPELSNFKGTRAEARLEGLARDRDMLARIGISGLITPSGYYFTWDELKDEWEHQRAQGRRVTDNGP